MPHLLYDTHTASLLAYPRLDDEPVQGLDSRYLALKLIEDPPPDHDPATEQLEATETIDFTAGEVRRGWAVKPIPPTPPAPDAFGFFAALSDDADVSGPIGNMLANMMDPKPNPDHAPQAVLGLSVGLGKIASDGTTDLFLHEWQRALQFGHLPPETIARVQQLAQAHNLSADFVAALQPQPHPDQS